MTEAFIYDDGYVDVPANQTVQVMLIGGGCVVFTNPNDCMQTVKLVVTAEYIVDSMTKDNT